MPDGSLLPNDICPEVSITVSNTVGTSKFRPAAACGPAMQLPVRMLPLRRAWRDMYLNLSLLPWKK